MHAKHKSPSIPQTPYGGGGSLGAKLSKEKERDGSWWSEFTAFNIDKMKYDRGRRASKELSFCGIDKFILLPRFVGGWSRPPPADVLARIYPGPFRTILLNIRFRSMCAIASLDTSILLTYFFFKQPKKNIHTLSV